MITGSACLFRCMGLWNNRQYTYCPHTYTICLFIHLIDFAVPCTAVKIHGVRWELCLMSQTSAFLLFLTPAGSFTSVSPAGSFTSRHPQTGTYLDGFEAPSSPRYSFTDPITANMGGHVTFEAPELPEETLMEVRSSVPTQLWKMATKEPSLL